MAKDKADKPSFVWFCCKMLLQCIFADEMSSEMLCKSIVLCTTSTVPTTAT